MRIRVVILALAVSSCMMAASIGPYTFNDNQFGNTLLESDGGAFSSLNWLNTANADPGNPGYLTGANFETGIANIGFTGFVSYTIGYGTPIVNVAGDDAGLVSARFSTNDTFTLAVSTDGVTFSAPVAFGPGAAVSTGVGKNYFYGGSGPQSSVLFVTPIDLSAFGLGLGSSAVAIQVSAAPEGDLIRIAGFGETTAIPEPSTLLLTGAGLCAVAWFRRRR